MKDWFSTRTPLEKGALIVAGLGISLLCGILSTCDARASARSELYSQAFKLVMCPPNWRATISQRYDDRDHWEWIVKRTWITRCY